MSMRPWEAVAVKTRTPVREAVMQADIAECSDSAVMRSTSKSPASCRSLIFSAMGVCGVMG